MWFLMLALGGCGALDGPVDVETVRTACPRTNRCVAPQSREGTATLPRLVDLDGTRWDLLYSGHVEAERDLLNGKTRKCAGLAPHGAGIHALLSTRRIIGGRRGYHCDAPSGQILIDTNQDGTPSDLSTLACISIAW